MTKLEELLFILGVTLPLIVEYQPKDARQEKMKKWLFIAIENVVYKNEKMPEFDME